MKKVIIIFLMVVLGGGTFVSYWVYARYFQQPVSAPLTYRVTLGNLNDILHVRGDVAAEREYDLAFTSFGTVAQVSVQEGQLVRTGELLMRLDTSDLFLQLKELLAEERAARAASEGAAARLSQALAARDAASAKLNELQRGTRPETLRVSEAKVLAAQKTLADDEMAMVTAVREALTSADNAVFDVSDQLFLNPQGNDPQLNFSLSDSGLHRNAELQRLGLEQMFVSWRTTVAGANITNIAQVETMTKINMQTVAAYLNTVSLAVNGAIPSSSVSATTITTWKANMSLARTDVNLALANLYDAEAVLRSAQSAYEIAQNEKQVLEAGSSIEQIAAQEAQVREAEANAAAYRSGVTQSDAEAQMIEAKIDLMRDKMRKASIYAPGSARVTKLWLKANEQYQQSLQGQPAVSLATTGIKIQSDISEIDIPKIREHDGNAVTIVFDAYPERTYSGKVISVEPKEILKEGDTYYRVNFQIDEPTEELRRGMSADVTVQVAQKSNVLKIPVFMMQEQSGKSFVTVFEQGATRQVEVRTGITDGDMVEITDGLTEGQTIIVSTK